VVLFGRQLTAKSLKGDRNDPLEVDRDGKLYFADYSYKRRFLIASDNRNRYSHVVSVADKARVGTTSSAAGVRKQTKSCFRSPLLLSNRSTCFLSITKNQTR